MNEEQIRAIIREELEAFRIRQGLPRRILIEEVRPDGRHRSSWYEDEDYGEGEGRS